MEPLTFFGLLLAGFGFSLMAIGKALKPPPIEGQPKLKKVKVVKRHPMPKPQPAPFTAANDETRNKNDHL